MAKKIVILAPVNPSAKNAQLRDAKTAWETARQNEVISDLDKLTRHARKQMTLTPIYRETSLDSGLFNLDHILITMTISDDMRLYYEKHLAGDESPTFRKLLTQTLKPLLRAAFVDTGAIAAIGDFDIIEGTTRRDIITAVRAKRAEWRQ